MRLTACLAALAVGRAFQPPAPLPRRGRALRASAPGFDLVKLGSSDLMLTKVGLGTMTWGGQQNTHEDGLRQMEYAFDERGVNWLDTAELYPVPAQADTFGETDEAVRRFLKQRGRDSVIVATKVSGASDRLTWMRDSGKGTRVTAKDIAESVEKSLKRLGTDYVDLLQVHWPDRYVPLFGADGYNATLEREAEPFHAQLEGLQAMVDSGKVRHIGVSNETPFGIARFDEASRRLPGAPRVVSCQNSYSLLVRADENGLTEACSRANCDVGLLAYSPLAGGALSGKYAGGKVDPNWRMARFEGYMERYRQSQAALAVDAYNEVAAKHGVSPTTLALSFCYSRPFLASTIIGATGMDQLRENLDAAAVPFTAEMEADVKSVYAMYRDPAKLRD